MKIKTNVLKNILKKVSVNDNVLLNFRDDGLLVVVMNESNTLKIRGFFKPENFIAYESVGLVPVQSFSNIIKLLDTLGEEVEIIVKEYLLTFKTIGGSRVVETELASKELFKEVEDKPFPTFEQMLQNHEVKTPSVVSMKNSELFNLINTIVNVNSRDYTFLLQGKDNNFVLSNTGRYRFTEKYNVPSISEHRAVYGEPLLEGIRYLTEDVVISFGTDTPCIVVEETPNSVVKVIVAPRVSND